MNQKAREPPDSSERLKVIERLLDEAELAGHSLTHDQLRQHLGVSKKTIQRDVSKIKRSGPVAKKPPVTREFLEVVEDHNFTTLSMIDRGLKRITEELEDLHDEMGFDKPECPTCGRKPLNINFQALQAKFKGEDSFNNQVQTRAKLLGELIDTQVVTVMQRDEDVATMLRRIAGIRTVPFQSLLGESRTLSDGSLDVGVVTEALMRHILAEFRNQSARRRRRLPSPIQIIDGISREVQDA